MSKLLVGSATDVGLVRSNNQDQLLVAPGLYAVADGMGGHAAGEVASATAVKALRAAFEASDQRSAEALLNAARAANRAVWEQAQSHRAMHGMGTTLVTIAVIEHQDGTNGLAVAHIGDSRAYLLREGTFSQLTIDHSLVQELINDGQISEAQAAVHPQRHVLTRALGVEPSVEVDLLAVDPRHGDRYLLCSDGLSREASDAEIAAVLEHHTDPSKAAKELVRLANSRGGSDNVTVVVVDVLANGAGPEAVISVGELRPTATNGVPAPIGHPGSLESTSPVVTLAKEAQARRTKQDGAPSPSTAPGELQPEGGAPDEEDATGFIEGWPDTASGPATKHARRKPAPNHPAATGPLTWRVTGFVLAVCVVVGGAIAAVAWYARSAYYVGLAKDRITIFQGRPGGVLWFQPTVAEQTRYTSAAVLPSELAALQSGYLEPSLARARQYISNEVADKVESEGVTPASARGAPRTPKHTSAHGTSTPKASTPKPGTAHTTKTTMLTKPATGAPSAPTKTAPTKTGAAKAGAAK